MLKITKAHEGKIVYCIPTGNNVSRHSGDRGPLTQMVTLEVSDVKRKYFKLGRSEYSLSYNEKSYTAKGDNNAGYIIFETEEAFTRYKEHLQDVSLIREAISPYGDLHLTNEQVENIAKIIKGENL